MGMWQTEIVTSVRPKPLARFPLRKPGLSSGMAGFLCSFFLPIIY